MASAVPSTAPASAPASSKARRPQRDRGQTGADQREDLREKQAAIGSVFEDAQHEVPVVWRELRARDASANAAWRAGPISLVRHTGFLRTKAFRIRTKSVSLPGVTHNPPACPYPMMGSSSMHEGDRLREPRSRG